MSKLPRPDAKALLNALQRAGFEVVRVRGSHHFLRHPNGRSTVVPVHQGETIGPGLLTRILQDCGIEPGELSRLL